MESVDKKVHDFLNKGRILEAGGDLQGAVRVYQRALFMDPEASQALNRLGVVAYRAGRLEQAEALIKRAIDRKPDRWEYHKDLGNVYKRQGRLEDAAASLLQAVSLSPESADAHFDLGLVYQIGGRKEQALTSYRSAVDRDPDCTAAWNNMGLIYFEQGNRDQAIDCFETAIDRKTDFTGAYNNLGNLYKTENNFQQAANCYQKSLSIDSKQASTYTLLGSTNQLMNMPVAAMECYQQAIHHQPDLADNWVNLGTVFQDLGNLKKAIQSYQKALAINPRIPQAYLNLGLVYKELGRNRETLDCFEEAFRLDSTCGTTLNHMVIHLYTQCDWNRLKYYNPLLDRMTRDSLAKGEKPFEDPFLNLIRHDRPQLNFQVACAWSKQIEKDCRKFVFSNQNKIPKKKRIRVGYLSANYRNHPGADLILGILEHYDRSSFDVYCYSWGKDDDSSQRKRIIDACDQFVDISHLNNHEAAKQIYSDQVDILVDLLGFLKNSRMAICAHRPAPIQARFLGFVGTTGAEFFDYFISDATITPIGQQHFFTEKLVLMPDSYLVNNYAKDNSCQLGTLCNAEGGDPFVFCCFNTAYKMDPVLFDVWMDILKKVPGSVLWLMPESSMVKKNLVKFARDHGIEGNRLEFKNKVSKPDHLHRLTLADLALDTLNINGVASTTDALWAGLPVLTLQGRHFASRISSSLLNVIGLPELITKNLEEYSSMAVKLAKNPKTLKEMRKKIEKNRISGPLFSTDKFVRYLEKAYLRMWDRHAEGGSAMPITILQ